MDKQLKESELLNVFEAELAEKGEKIGEYRKKYCQGLTVNSSSIYNELSSLREELEVVYMPSCSDELAERSTSWASKNSETDSDMERRLSLATCCDRGRLTWICSPAYRREK